MASHADVVESVCFPSVKRLMPWSKPPLPLNRMFPADGEQRQWSRSVSSSSGSSHNTDGSDASMSELARSDGCFSQSTGGSDVAMTDIEEHAIGWLVESSEPSPVFQLQLMCQVREVR